MIKNIKYTLVFIVLIFSSHLLLSSPIDSLKTLIDNETNDSNKVELLLELSKKYINGNKEHKLYIEKAFKIAQTLDIPYLTAETYFSKGSMLNYYDEYDSAVVYIEEAIEIFTNLQDTFYLVAAWGELGNMHCFKANYDECLDCFLKALRYIEYIDNDMYKGIAMNNIGSVYFLLEEYEEAYDYYRESYITFVQIQSEYGIALSANNIGSVYLEYYNNLDSAYKYFKISEKNANYIEYNEQLAETSVNLAKLFGMQNKYNLAVEYYQKAIHLQKTIEDRSGIAQSYISFANLYFNKKLFTKAKIYLDSSITISVDIGALEKQAQAYKWLYKCDSAMNNFELAFLHIQKFQNLEDSIAKIDVQEKIATLNAEFEVERKEKENIILKEQQEKQNLINQKRKIYNILSSIAIVLFLFLIIFLYKNIRNKKRHYEILISKNQEISQQKEEILTQNEELNVKNDEINEQRNILQKYQTNTKASINYAKRIQSAVMPDTKELLKVFSDTFLIDIPRDIISGDFYFFSNQGYKSIVAVADSTGHGVPGGLMSILNMTLFKEVLRAEPNLTAAQILNKVRDLVKKVLNQESKKQTLNDGMDVAMLVYDKQKSEINFSGAYRPMYLFRNGNLTIYEADRQPICAHIKEKAFTNNFVDVQKNDIIYIFSDGYYDQISEKTNRTLGIKQFRKILTEICKKPMKEQKYILTEKWKQQKGDNRQTDDIIILTLKI